MKNSIILSLAVVAALLCAVAACYGQSPTKTSEGDKEKVKLLAEVERLRKENKELKDSVEYLTKSIPEETYMNARRMEKIKYYIAITERRPANKKYFYGWIRRTMKD